MFPGGGFGGDLHEAVEGNAEAERYAKSYRTNMIAGVTTALAGVASAIGGSVLYMASSTKPDNERDGTAEAIGGTMVVSGIAAYVTGMVLMLNAQPHLWDAVNAYNDGVDPGFSVRAYGTHVTPPNGSHAPSATYAPANQAPRGAKQVPPSDPSNFPVATDAPNAPGATAPFVAPPPPPPRAPSADPSSGPPPDLDLDEVESK